MRALSHFIIALTIAVLLSPLFPLLVYAGDNFRMAPP
jgi:hypothetical protein